MAGTQQSNLPTITNNTPFDSLNQCRVCGGRAGKYWDQEAARVKGRFLYADARGGKVCNVCKDRYGDHLPVRKITKKERKQLTKMKHEMRNLGGIKHITLDAKGRKII
jgi:hypothetical protein